jgi:hypothetical protein
MSMYGGGFATIPAYLSDIFGTQYVGAIHGRLLTAWSAAGIAGPVLINYIRQFQVDRGAAPSSAYNLTMYLMAGLLVVGFFCNQAVSRAHTKDRLGSEGTRPRVQIASGMESSSTGVIGVESASNLSAGMKLVFVWVLVLLPLSWGIFMTCGRALLLFQ